MTATAADWIACDWGTSNLRLWAMQGGEVIEMRSSDRGMSAMTGPEDFADELARMTEGWPALPVVACGMVGARQGWLEVPYRAVPCPAVPTLTPVPGDPGGRPVLIAGGVMQAQPPDVMRGEETQIAGVLAARPDFDGVICLPGTHTKWVHISAGEVVSFATFMTGELFGLLSTSSVLHYTMDEGGWSDAAFDGAVEESLAMPEQVARKLFGIRAEALLSDLTPGESRARLSGLLVGIEIGGSRPYWLGRDIVLVGESDLATSYARALGICGLSPRRQDPTDLVIAGLGAARADLLAQRAGGTRD